MIRTQFARRKKEQRPLRTSDGWHLGRTSGRKQIHDLFIAGHSARLLIGEEQIAVGKNIEHA